MPKYLKCLIIYVCLTFFYEILPAQTSWFSKFREQVNIPPLLIGTDFDLSIQENTTRFFTQGATSTYGINGSFLGPTLLFKKGDPITLNVSNDFSYLTTLHWHGLHVPPKYDGGPQNHIHPNTTWSPSFTIQDEAATYWYHTHPHHETTNQATLGLMGLIIVEDSAEQLLDLPGNYGVDDIPLIIQSKSFNFATKDIVPLGSETHFLVNSKIYPFLNVPRQLVRLRLLNGSNLRVINIGFTDNRTFYQITTDGSLLEKPVPLTRVKLSTGERAEILVDFSDLADNHSAFYMVNYASELPPGTPGTLITAAPSILDSRDVKFMQIIVKDTTPNPVFNIPNTLRTPHNIWSENQAVVTRKFKLQVDLPLLFSSGFIKGFSIDNELFDENKVNFEVQLDDIEIWEIYNNTPFSHPFHIHGTQFYLLDRKGQLPPDNEMGKKDVVLIDPYEKVRLIMQFKDFADDEYKYLYHCHILSHEDEGMMGQFLVKERVTHVENTYKYPVALIFPNPLNNSQEINVEFEKSMPGIDQIYMYDNLGRVVMKLSSDIPVTKYRIDVSGLSSGVYLLQFLNNNELVGVGKFSIQE